MPAHRIRETDVHGFAVDDAFPVSPGHSLIIVNRHVESFFDLTEDEVPCLMNLLQAVRRRLDKSHMPVGYNIGVNNGTAAGQTIMHVHIHLIPRYAGDVQEPFGGVRNVLPNSGPYPKD